LILCQLQRGGIERGTCWTGDGYERHVRMAPGVSVVEGDLAPLGLWGNAGNAWCSILLLDEKAPPCPHSGQISLFLAMHRMFHRAEWIGAIRSSGHPVIIAGSDWSSGAKAGAFGTFREEKQPKRM
jgi:hypothetical protein